MPLPISQCTTKPGILCTLSYTLLFLARNTKVFSCSKFLPAIDGIENLKFFFLFSPFCTILLLPFHCILCVSVLYCMFAVICVFTVISLYLFCVKIWPLSSPILSLFFSVVHSVSRGV